MDTFLFQVGSKLTHLMVFSIGGDVYEKGNAVWLVVLVLAVVIVVWFISTYNGLVKQDEAYKRSMGPS